MVQFYLKNPLNQDLTLSYMRTLLRFNYYYYYYFYTSLFEKGISKVGALYSAGVSKETFFYKLPNVSRTRAIFSEKDTISEPFSCLFINVTGGVAVANIMT